MKLGDYFKQKESETGATLQPKGYFIMRLDGKAFHTFTRGLNKPFDLTLSQAMVDTTRKLCTSIQNIKMGYTQSDEISLILSDLNDTNPNTSLWYDGDVQKMVSVSSSMCTAFFNNLYQHTNKDSLAFFDSRVFRVDTLEDVQKYLVWRQRDSIKNGTTLVSLKHYSDKQIHGKHTGEKIEMIKAKGDSLDNYELGLIQGYSILKESKEVPFVNPKTNEEGLVTRTFWNSLAAEDFMMKFLL